MLSKALNTLSIFGFEHESPITTKTRRETSGRVSFSSVRETTEFSKAADTTPREKLCFFFTADFGKDCPQIKEVAAAMDHYARTYDRPTCIFGIGDNFYPQAPDTPDDPIFDIVWRGQFLEKYPSLRVPWRMALGNHDYNPSPNIEIDYHYDRKLNADRLWYLPDRYYQVTEEAKGNSDANLDFSVDFYVLDTNGCDRTVSYYHPEAVPLLHQQVRELDSVLPRSTSRWKILMGHHPMYNAGYSHGVAGRRLREPAPTVNIDPKLPPSFGLEPVCIRHGVDAYFAGHEHIFQAHKAHGVHHICVGASGASIRNGDGFYGGLDTNANIDWTASKSDYGFVVVELTYDRMVIKFVNVQGEIIQEFVQSK